MTLKPETRRRGPVPARFALSDEILEIARRQARKVGLGADDAEDCALAFVGRVLLDDGEAMLRPRDARHRTGTYCEAWVVTCAKNHARRFRRRLAVVAAHEREWPVWRDAVGQACDLEAPDAAPGPEDLLLRAVVRRELDAALARLAPEPCAFFLRHHGEGETARDIARDAGRTAHAVEACLTRTHGRLRSLLGRSGASPEEGAPELRFVFARAPVIASA